MEKPSPITKEYVNFMFRLTEAQLQDQLEQFPLTGEDKSLASVLLQDIISELDPKELEHLQENVWYKGE